jgi:hypothetical protein
MTYAMQKQKRTKYAVMVRKRKNCVKCVPHNLHYEEKLR